MNIKSILSSILLTVSICASASDCPDLYPNQVELQPQDTVELCSSFFISRYSKDHRAVILVSEKLTKGSDVGKEERINAFHADTRVPSSPTPSEYLNTHHDKGHMAPAGDSASPEQMHETFLMTNMTPQNKNLNEVPWRLLEDKVRKQFVASGLDMWVVNVAVYSPGYLSIGKGIPIPEGYWEIVYSADKVNYYYGKNEDGQKIIEVQDVDVQKLIQDAGKF
jgi:endonuclease G, mitochondrial